MVSEVLDGLIESGRLPDPLLRFGIRVNLATRLARERRKGSAAKSAFVDALREAPIACEVEKANEQHYELPAEFFQLVLGPRLKYSSCLWEPGTETLAAAEEAMLALTCERAGVEDGMTILDLGCGWGSLTLWLAERYPSSPIVAVSNSRVQRDFLAPRLPANVEIVTADVNDWEPRRRFDRILSVEMLEHVSNYERLFGRIAGWLEPGGRFFAHVFSHRRYAYAYDGTWMARKFFTAGNMPSNDLLLAFQRDLVCRERWQVDGTHYARTAEAWLKRLDGNLDAVRACLGAAYGEEHATAWLGNWRVFFLACAELWGYRSGREWMVSHYLFDARDVKSWPRGGTGRRRQAHRSDIRGSTGPRRRKPFGGPTA
jgi:cyclopropane-fatty-acyl-phospholipid synthase